MRTPRRLAPLLLALACAAAACTTSFDPDQLRAPLDATVDAGPTPDRANPDGPSPDGPAPTCGALNAACCAGGAAASPCAAGLVCSGGVCLRCPGSLAACEGSCVDLTASPVHCGNCGAACAEGQTCVAGTCRLACATGLLVCGGRCVQPLSNPEHCGTCGNRCAFAHATAMCNAGTCAMGPCDAGYGDCDRNPANGCEAPLTTEANCGACGMTCRLTNAASATCREGACAVGTCEANFADCDRNPANGCETDTRTNAIHCGACGTRCATAQACRAGACVTAMMCAAPTADCDATGGCEADTSTDVANCGACGNRCALAGATSRCVAGACAVASCEAGLGDCDMMAANGCETDTRTALAHCGACGRACAPAHAAGACVAGACRVASCEAGWGDCDGNPANGCETDTRASAGNCGACGVACAAAGGTASCVDGRCAVGACNAGLADCDRNPANGCETDTRTSEGNCGACGSVCTLPNAGVACAGGACGLASCREGFADCDMSAANGCEADTRSDPSRCGGCGTACSAPNATAACVAGRCAVGACAPGFADCNASPADGCEVNVASDAANCGRCGGQCPPGQLCASGGCLLSCPAGRTVCGTACVDTQTSAAHCGRCGNRCPGAPNAAPACVGGACALACNANFGDCDGNPNNGCETDLRLSARNCGRCGNACPSGDRSSAVCVMGACALACSSGYGNCDGVGANGCEVSTATDPGNCGSCGRACAPLTNTTAGCNSGFCAYACTAGYGNCDGMVGNGCETNVTSSMQHCGRCNNPCMGGRVCTAGQCRCPSGQTECSGRCVDTNADRGNCGTCGRACNLGLACVGGVCLAG